MPHIARATINSCTASSISTSPLQIALSPVTSGFEVSSPQLGSHRHTRLGSVWLAHRHLHQTAHSVE
ncbi:hypothetical protein Mapa_000936 [Marchantia paleacea]|nr:hypothetical protein Mapa_000936 [Marchantia paleacea]